MRNAARWDGDRRGFLLSVLAAIVGLCLVLDASRSSSATYDETAYLRIGCRWWRTGDQEQISRMGSPLTFWKLQQVPTLWAIDLLGLGELIDHPVEHEARLLTILRMGAVWVWLSGLVVTSFWARRLYGPNAMAFAAWIFALSPNLIAHGSLITMEMPIIASTAAVGLLFTIFLQTQDRRAFLASAVMAGLAFSCKFTAVLIPPILALCWFTNEISKPGSTILQSFVRVMIGMIGFCLVLGLGDLLVTGFARLPLSERIGPHPTLDGRPKFLANLVELPLPQDLVGFAIQFRHQKSGGPSYLLGETRTTGWWYYYPVALMVKTPPIVWLLIASRAVLIRRRDGLLPLAIGAFLAVTILGSSRNYGVRYLLPVSPVAIVWISALCTDHKIGRWIAAVGVIGFVYASLSIHPRELSYFPQIVGGSRGGRAILADSNLDWGQGLKDLAELQRQRPEFQDLTTYYFGDTHPRTYGVAGMAHVIDASDRHPGLPARLRVSTRFVAVSASLQFGPWGPPGYFDALRGLPPIASTPDWTISVYEMPVQ